MRFGVRAMGRRGASGRHGLGRPRPEVVAEQRPVGLGTPRLGHDAAAVVHGLDKIRSLRDGTMPFHEPGMDELVPMQRESGRRRLSDEFHEAIAYNALVFDIRNGGEA